MVSFPPLFPSVGWFSYYLSALKNDLITPVCYANSNIGSTKEFGRYHLIDSKGESINLSVAIQGGGKRLRSLDKIMDLELSDHGEWRKNHLGSIEACLGRKPYYRYIEEPLKEVYLNTSLVNLESFNLAIFKIVDTFLMGNLKAQDLQHFFTNPCLIERGHELAEKFKPDISILQYLSEYGRESILGIMALNKN